MEIVEGEDLAATIARGPLAQTPFHKTQAQIAPAGSQSTWFATRYDVTADGQRFAINGPAENVGACDYHRDKLARRREELRAKD